MRPFRFLATVDGYPRFAELTSLARKAEAVGCSTFVGEHTPSPATTARPSRRSAAPADLPGRRRQAPADPGAPAQIIGLARGWCRATRPARRPEPDRRGNRRENQLDPRGRRRPLRRTELNTYPTGGPTVATSDPRAEARRRADLIREQTGIELTVEEILDSPHVFIGSIKDLTRKFADLRERFGISSFLIDDLDALAPVVEDLAGR